MQRPAWLAFTWWKVRLLGEWTWLKKWWQPPENLKGLNETERWATTYGALRDQDDGAYSLTMDYAKERYDEIVRVSESLDKKLDEIAKTALTIGTIVAAVARIEGLDTALLGSPMAPWAVILLMLTVILANMARRPNKSWKPMSARTLLEVADLEPNLPKNRIEAVVAASYHDAMIKMTAMTEWKAEQANRVTWLFCIGLLPIAALLLFAPTTPSSSSGGKGDRMLEPGTALSRPR